MPTPSTPIREQLLREGTLMLWVIPNARTSGIQGFIEGPQAIPHLKLKVTAPAEDGKANDAVLALLSRTLELPVSQLTITSGATSRFKRLAYIP